MSNATAAVIFLALSLAVIAAAVMLVRVTSAAGERGRVKD